MVCSVKRRKLPTGLETFRKIREEDCYLRRPSCAAPWIWSAGLGFLCERWSGGRHILSKVQLLWSQASAVLASVVGCRHGRDAHKRRRSQRLLDSSDRPNSRPPKGQPMAAEKRSAFRPLGWPSEDGRRSTLCERHAGDWRSSGHMKNNPLPRLDKTPDVREKLIPYCRLRPGEVWRDDVHGHRVGCLDAADREAVADFMAGERAQLAIHDPPYNLAVFERRSVSEFIDWCGKWIVSTTDALAPDASLYVWLGADQNNGFQPLPDFMVMMRDQPFRSRSFVTMRNQRGYGTQKNWMAVRQELLYYVRGDPSFNVDAEYTEIPKILRGYYKSVNGKMMENVERSRSETIRAGNVWVDIQQVFYRMSENVSGCYAQKPFKCIDRIIRASSSPGDLTVDFFAHSGTTLLASERLGRRCFTTDIDPIYAEISIRRLERFRDTGQLGWQNGRPFQDEVPDADLSTATQGSMF